MSSALVCRMQMRLLAFLFLTLLSFHAQASSNQCQSLFGVSTYRDDQALGPQIFNRELKEVSDTFALMSDLSWSQQIDTLVAQDNRKLFFHLRVLSQTYGKKDAKYFSKKEASFKNVEFLLGRVQLYQSLNQILIDLKEPEVAQVFLKEQKRAGRDLKKALKDFSVENIANELRSYGWDSPKKDRKFLLKETLNYARELNENIRNDKYNSADLEEGLHRLRRRLRELIYRIVNLDGLVSLVDEESLPAELSKWYGEFSLNYPAMANSPYLPQRNPEINSPFVVGRQSLSVLTQMVAEIGLSKDKDEPLFYIEGAINDGPFDSKTKARALRKLEKMRSESVDSRDVANYYQQRIRDTHLLEVIIAFLEEHNR